MNILLVLNKPNREMEVMQSISKELLLMDPHARVEIWDMYAPHFNAHVLRFRPDVILTFPFTSVGTATWYYLYKLLFACKMLTLRAEGATDLRLEYNVQLVVGFDRYGSHLVDHELFWGSQMADIVGGRLLQQGRLASRDRLRVVGYPRLESCLSAIETKDLAALPERLQAKMRSYDRRKTVFFVTGFHMADYTRENLFAARDLDAEHRIEELLRAIEITREFRQAWVDSIIATADKNRDMLIIVKKHPAEKIADYRMLESISNLLYVYEDVGIHDIMPHVGLFLHYGSTSLVDSYLAHVPSAYVFFQAKKSWYTDLGWPSARKAAVSDVPNLIQEYRTTGIPFVMTDEIRAVLKRVFDFEEGLPYRPSRRIAEVIMEKDEAQRIPITDKYLWKSLLFLSFAIPFGALSRMMNRMFKSERTLSHLGISE